MRVEVETITPEYAKHLLGSNANNRRLSPRRVRRLADAMRRGEWVTTHQGVAIGANGELLDGQHRLQAVVLSGCTVDLVVAYDVTADAKPVMDTGGVRTAADVLDMQGRRNSRMVVSVARIRMTVEGGGRTHVDTFTTPQLIEYLDAHPSIDATAAAAGTTARYLAAVRKSSLGAALSMIREADRDGEGFARFVTALQTGADLAAGDPRLTLRNYGSHRHAQPLTSVAATALVVKAWNGYVTGRQRMVLKWVDSEAFPVVLTP